MCVCVCEQGSNKGIEGSDKWEEEQKGEKRRLSYREGEEGTTPLLSQKQELAREPPSFVRQRLDEGHVYLLLW